MNTLSAAQAAAGQRAAVAVATALHHGFEVPWSACMDSAAQWPAVVSVLASRMLAALGSGPVDVEEYLQAWGAEAALGASQCGPQTPDNA